MLLYEQADDAEGGKGLGMLLLEFHSNQPAQAGAMCLQSSALTSSPHNVYSYPLAAAVNAAVDPERTGSPAGGVVCGTASRLSAAETHTLKGQELGLASGQIQMMGLVDLGNTVVLLLVGDVEGTGNVADVSDWMEAHGTFAQGLSFVSWMWPPLEAIEAEKRECYDYGSGLRAMVSA